MYLGDTMLHFVQEGNAQMVVTSIVWMVSYWIGNRPILEQPLDSVMVKAPPLSTCLQFTKSFRITTYLQAFGAPTLKPLQIW